MNVDEQSVFSEMLELVGSEVVIGVNGRSTPLQGKVTYVMFDSVLVEAQGTPHVVRFIDILYISPLRNAA